MLIAGDVGGTKTNLGIYESANDLHKPLIEATMPSSSYPGLSALVKDFLEKNELDAEYAVFGVAGPVVKSQATITNLPWIIEEKSLSRELGLKSVRLLNDLEAIAFGVPLLEKNDLYTLNEGEKNPSGPMAVIAPGTGLGEAYITWDSGRHTAHASEGGHTDFAPTSDLEMELLSYLLDRYEHVSYECICSGMGLPHIYDFLKDKGYYNEPSWLSAGLIQTDDRTAVIVNTALDSEKPCVLCSKTLEIFLSILGAEAGNLALKIMATGGVYLGGGIPPRIISAFTNRAFMNSFTQKGRLSYFLKQIPVNIILNPKVALMGAASFGLELMNRPE
jgi:glucokinase